MVDFSSRKPTVLYVHRQPSRLLMPRTSSRGTQCLFLAQFFFIKRCKLRSRTRMYVLYIHTIHMLSQKLKEEVPTYAVGATV